MCIECCSWSPFVAMWSTGELFRVHRHVLSCIFKFKLTMEVQVFNQKLVSPCDEWILSEYRRLSFFFLSSFFPIHYWAGNNQGIKQRLSMGEHSLPTAPCLNKKQKFRGKCFDCWSRVTPKWFLWSSQTTNPSRNPSIFALKYWETSFS